MMHVVLAGVMFLSFALDQTGNQNNAIVRGKVTTGWPSYRPVANMRVVAQSDVDVRETRTDANGNYIFLTLLPGTYLLYAYRCIEQGDAPHELSAGLEYVANIELTTRCL